MFRLILIGIICFQSVYALELRIGSSAESYEQYSIRILKAKSPSRLLNQKFIEAVKLYQSKESHKSLLDYKKALHFLQRILDTDRRAIQLDQTLECKTEIIKWRTQWIAKIK